MRAATAPRVNAGFCCLLWIVLAAAPRAWAGPNAGGTLVVHDPGVEYTSGTLAYPTPVTECTQIDNQLPVGIPAGGEGWVWKVYAAFDPATEPRLKGVRFGATFTPEVVILAGGVPDPSVYEVSINGWPSVSGGGAELSFLETQTSPVVECYWLGGYCASETGTWTTAPHPVVPAVFLDDSSVPAEDPILAFGSVGFGQPGFTICPPADEPGACCFLSGVCLQLSAADCATQEGTFHSIGVPCTPDLCPALLGACCHGDESCSLTFEEDCELTWLGGGTSCEPWPCGFLFGACCHADETCSVTIEEDCELTWLGGGTSCEPWPCGFLFGACCPWGGGPCYITLDQECGFDWISGTDCSPNPCPTAPGACCHVDGSCEYLTPENCYAGTYHEGVACDPNPCPVLEGACCWEDGSCRLGLDFWCAELHGSWQGSGVPCDPNPCPNLHGACCLADGSCVSVPEQYYCVWYYDGVWQGEGTSCDPNPCTPTALERMSWGRIKAVYR